MAEVNTVIARWSRRCSRGGTEADGSVTISITAEGYRCGLGGRSGPTGGRAAQAWSPSRLDDHSRSYAISFGRLIDGQKAVGLVDQAPRTIAGHTERDAVESQAAATFFTTSIGTTTWSRSRRAWAGVSTKAGVKLSTGRRRPH